MRIAVVPDTQCKPKANGRAPRFDHLRHVGQYIADKQPDVIVHLGDHADMPSLSSYDKGKKSFEGRRYRNDIAASTAGMDALMTPIAKVAGYNPRKILCYGNHEERILRLVEVQPEFEGDKSLEDLKYADWGWECHEFLRPVIVSGVAFCHYFTSGPMGRPISTAAALLAKRHMPAVAGHQQGYQASTAVRADGALMNGIITGSCYVHDEQYLTPQGNNHYRGMLFLNDVRRNGEFEPMPLTLSFLQRRYG